MKYLPLIACILLSACNSVPQKLAVPGNTQLTPYSPTAAADPTKPQQARWGGRIAAIENRADSSVLDVVNLPLHSSSRPQETDESQGRFRVYVQGFIDPQIYRPGRLLTVVGTIGVNEQIAVGKHLLEQPALYATALYLWQEPIKTETEFVYVPYIVRTPVYIPRP